ncbi:Ig-like domain-containing protein [Flavobacterium sp.]|uniref:Ig-like domain-containing protein n=1 Tax=Flavobacterium sp. TaxID=239 RepID=UPI00261D109F|nr:Ig-like domain-containing protein [Flavobacterium sp.]
MKAKKLLTSLIVSVIVLFTGCEKDDFEETVGLCPIVLTTNPANNATFVPVDQVITATFNKEMNSATITQASFKVQQGTTAILGAVSFSGTTATFTPAVSLTANTTYTGIITTSVKDLMGNSLQEDYVWTFSTGGSITPLVISTDPANNATDVFLNKTVSATFNMPMYPLTINGTTFTVKQGTTSVPGTVTYSGITAYFTPSGLFLANTVYTATITTGAQNVSGTPLANSKIWTFTTGSITAPFVSTTDPTNNASGVALNKVIMANFSMPMNPLTVDNTTFLLRHGATIVTGTVSYLGTTASFTPSSDLLMNTTYTATITTGAKNVAGIPLANNYVWTFSTNATIGAQNVDLGSAEDFGILAGVGVSNNAGFSQIHNMNVGISPGVRSSITGFPPAIIVNGAMYASDDSAAIAAMLSLAKQHLVDAYLFAEGATSPAPATVAGDLGGTTLAPGIYKSTSTLLVQSGNLTLDAQGDANAVWIFQIASDFTTIGGAGGSIILSGGAQAKNVFWQTGSSATIGDNTSFKGNVLALTSITMNSNATAEGRMLARNGSVVMTSTNIITKP